jgi:hypothetical protein
MIDVVTAIGLVLVIEGVLYAVAPQQVKRMMALASGTPAETLRMGGLIAAGLGVAIVWLARSVIGAS